jgi:hypothetical protein
MLHALVELHNPDATVIIITFTWSGPRGVAGYTEATLARGDATVTVTSDVLDKHKV